MAFFNVIQLSNWKFNAQTMFPPMNHGWFYDQAWSKASRVKHTCIYMCHRFPEGERKGRLDAAQQGSSSFNIVQHHFDKRLQKCHCLFSFSLLWMSKGLVKAVTLKESLILRKAMCSDRHPEGRHPREREDWITVMNVTCLGLAAEH